MAAITTKVNPGDVISSELLNLIIDLLNEHEALLGGSGPISITDVIPPARRVGEEINVSGSGLAAANLQEITVGGTNVPIGALKSGSSDALMVFDVPQVMVPPAGQSVDVIVKNKGGSVATHPLYVLPAIVSTLSANFTVTRTTVTPGGNLAANTSYEFTFSIETFSTQDETYVLEPKLIGASPGWTVAPKNNASEVFIPKSQPTPSTNAVVMVVTTGAAGGATLSLGIRSKNFSTVTGSSMPEAISIGATPPAPNLDIEFMTPTVLGSVQKFANGSLYIRTDANVNNQKATINPLNVRLKTGGVYAIGPAVVSSNQWTVTITNNPASFDTTGLTNAIKAIIFTVSAQANAPDADLDLPITGAGPLPHASFKCKLKLRADPSNPIPL